LESNHLRRKFGGGGKALAGAVIDPEQAFAVGLALISDSSIELDEGR
jgi:hypothetical protein